MKLLIYGLAIGFVFEVFTLILRFYFDLESTRDTTLIGIFTGGIRLHHGYIGALLMLVAFFYLRRAGNLSSTTFTSMHWLLAFGVGLITSDVIHHFLVLWTMTGDPQFDLVYPDR